jgi:DNA-directed RNA polymerase specialized sigma24 family protein
MLDFINSICQKLCQNLFDESSHACVKQIKLKEKIHFILSPSTELKIKINRQINHLCAVHKNRFWILYYRLTEKKIDFTCKQCHKYSLCQAYILQRILKHIKAFNSQQESIVFKVLKKKLTQKASNIQLTKESQEIVSYYEAKIHKTYEEKTFDIHTGTALVQNVLTQIKNLSLQLHLEERLAHYKLYDASFVLKVLLEEENPYQEELFLLKETMLLELLEREKFLNYIKSPIKSRYIDFVRSKPYTNENRLEEETSSFIEEKKHVLEKETLEEFLNILSNEQKLLYKLRYGLKLNNREFLTISPKFQTLYEELIDCFDSTEKLYIKFSIHYNLEEDSEHFQILGDLPSIKNSISTKLLKYREKLLAQSYKEGKDEIVLKLVYSEALNAKELSSLFDLSDKQIHKKIENIKKKLKQ